MDRRRSGLSTWRGDGTWSRNRGSYTITYDGKRGVDFKASSGPSWAARPRRFDGRHGRAKVFTHRLRVGTRVGNPPDSAGGSSPAPAPRFDGSSAMREMVLGPADYPLPRPELARDLTGGGTMVP